MKKASDVLAKLLEENSRGKAHRYVSVFRDWRDVVGLSLADHSRVYEVRHESLFVEVDHNGWMQMLLLRKSRVLGNLRRKFPELEIRDIKVRVNPALGSEPDGSTADRAMGGDSSVGTGSAAPAGGRSPGESEQQREEKLERVLAGVPDESLRQRLRKLFESNLRNRRRP